VVDNNEKVIYQQPAQAQAPWMTTNFVPFRLDVKIKNYSRPATLILKKDNPSGLSDREAYISFPILIAP
jgi:hypothetical protein